MFFSVILVNAPLVLNRDDRSLRFRRQTVKVEVRTGAIVKIPEFYSVGGARSKNSIFRVFSVPFDYLAHSLLETVLPQLKGAESGHMTITKKMKICI